jgi:signal transduction histidine kinase
LAKRTLKPIERDHLAQVRFVAHASHELRTPLAAIKADTESVLMEANSDQKLLVKTLRANLRDVKKLEQLTSHLLEVAKYQTVKQVSRESFDISKIIQQSVTQAKRTKIGKTRKIVYKKINVFIKGDPLAIQLLISTLLDNAIKYSPKTSTIEIELIPQDKFIAITIINSGQGINVKELPYVFEPFYRPKESIKNSLSGYGLGLTLAKQIVALHHGSLTITSQSRGDTIAKVLLPIR